MEKRHHPIIMCLILLVFLVVLDIHRKRQHFNHYLALKEQYLALKKIKKNEKKTTKKEVEWPNLLKV